MRTRCWTLPCLLLVLGAAGVARAQRPTATAAPVGRLPEAGATFDTAWAIIARTHWDTTYNGVNWQAVRDSLRPRALAAGTPAALRTVLSAMVASLRQSHFAIIPREVGEATPTTAASAARGEPGATGLTLRFVHGVVLVSHVAPGSAAAQAGVRMGWAVDAVNGTAMAPRLRQLSQGREARAVAFAAVRLAGSLLGGSVGDTVQASFRDGTDRRRSVTMVLRAEPGVRTRFLNLPPQSAVHSVERVRAGGRTVGIIAFNIWMPALSAALDSAVDAVRDADGIVLDLRGNPGGVGGMAMGIAGHFLDSAVVIGTMHQRGATLHFTANPRRVNTRLEAVRPYAGPLALLVDDMSASTTEIFASGLQQLGRARVFGVQSSGQALPALAERLPNGDILYHAIADFVSPRGIPIEGPGVTPDVATPLTRAALLAGRDPAREAALAWLATAPRP